MIIFDIITIFPNIFDSYFGESIIARAQKEGNIQIRIHDLRNYALDKHKTVDDTPYGGGAGMVLKLDVIYEALVDIIGRENIPCFRKENKGDLKIVLFSAKGKEYNQQKAEEFSAVKRFVFICGRYEGVDERVSEYLVDEELSVGNFVLTGGEIPAMLVIDSVTRLLDGVLGNSESLVQESFSLGKEYLEYPQYTKPEIFIPKKGTEWSVPNVLLSGHHEKIRKWKEENSSKKA